MALEQQKIPQKIYNLSFLTLKKKNHRIRKTIFNNLYLYANKENKAFPFIVLERLLE